MRLLLISCAVIALAACHKPSQPISNQPSEAAPEEQGKGVDRSHKGTAAPSSALDDGTAFDAHLSRSSDMPTLVNLWATWCAPCVKELPTIDRLARKQQVDGDLRVIAISQDSAPHASVEAFLKRLGIREVGTSQDSKMALSGALAVEVLPTTILYDAKGREVWRYVGELDWTGPEAARLLAEGGVSKKR